MNSSVCSMAILRYPSRQARMPLYSCPELSLTLTGLPMTDLRKSEGDLLGISVVSGAYGDGGGGGVGMVVRW